MQGNKVVSVILNFVWMSNKFIVEICWQISDKGNGYANDRHRFECWKSSQETHGARRNGMSLVHCPTELESLTSGNS
jgi:hypothetical protein